MKIVSSAVAVLCSVVALAQTAPRSFAVPGHGAVSFAVPAGWTEEIQASGRGLAPTFEFTEEKSGTKLLVTPLATPADNPQFMSRDNLRVLVARSAERAQPTAVEPELLLRDIATSSGDGWYFQATDRAPKAGEFKFMANGAVPAGKLLLSFTVLSHHQPPEGVAGALAIVKSASSTP